MNPGHPNASMRRHPRFPGIARALATLALGAAAWLGAAGAPPAHAQQPRPVQLPADGRYGEMTAFDYPQALVGKVTLRLAPGARIYDRSNLIVMPAAVPRSGGPVLYKLDIHGQVAQMWLLTPEEAAAAKKRSATASP